jgi:NAD(P)-dependent dehydrogenase (short-subunit alcohol dehydrogenase family)
LASELDQAGGAATIVQKRPNSKEDCAAIVEAAVAAFGRVDILVVASGMNDIGMVADMDVSRFENVMHANVTGSWMMSQAAGRQMIAQGDGGKIVLVSSTRGELGHPAGYSAYCSSKHAVNGITKALGCEWGKERITVNAIAPTVFRSDLTEWMFSDEDPGKTTREGMLSRIPAGRLGEPEDLAGPLLFLVSPASDFYTGHILYADGGYTAG